MSATTTKHTIAKLEIIKELARDKSVQQLCDVLIKHIQSESKGSIGFNKGDES